MITIQTTDVFDAWFSSLKDRRAATRIHYGPGYRVYFMKRDRAWVILLAGGDKATQAKDIKSALALAREL